MEGIEALEEKRDLILGDILAIELMRKGNTYKVRGNWHYGVSEGLNLKRKELSRYEVAQYNKEREAYDEFKSLCDQYATIMEKITDLRKDERDRRRKRKIENKAAVTT